MALKAYERNGELWGPSPDEVLGEGHLARVIDELVEAIEGLERLNEAFRHTPGEPAYNVKMLLKVLLYAYGRGITSSREMARQCEESLAFRYLTGNATPDHRTLSRFRRKRRVLIRWVFKQVVRLGRAAGLVRLGLVALDSVRVEANARAGSKRTLEEVSKELEELEGYLEEVEREDRDGDAAYGEEGREDTLPKGLASVKRRREALLRAKAQLEADREQAAGGAKVRRDVLPSDPEAQWVKKGRRIIPGYSGQVVADGEAGFIVAAEAVRGGDDRGQLAPMVRAVERTVGEAPAVVVADNGYYSEEAVGAVEGEKTKVVVPDGQAARQINLQGEVSAMPPYHVDRFRYEAQADQFRCPQGQVLRFFKARRRRGQATKVYRGVACRDCPVRGECTRDKSGVRSVEVPVMYEKVKAVHERIRTAEGMGWYRRRKAIVERIFGHWQHNLRIRRLQLRGLAGATVELLLMAIAYNMRLIGQARLARAAAAS